MGVNEIIKIGNQIKAVRKARGISQRDFAKKLNIPVSTYSNYENNNREPDSETLIKIAAALKVSPYYLIARGNKEILDDYTFFKEYTSKLKPLGVFINFLYSIDITISLPYELEEDEVNNIIKDLKDVYFVEIDNKEYCITFNELSQFKEIVEKYIKFVIPDYLKPLD